MELAGKRLEQECHCLKKRDELMLFVTAGEIQRVKFVLGGTKKVDVRMRDFTGNNLIALAVEADRIVILQRLIDAGAGVDNIDYCGHTPIMMAATHDHVECTYVLVVHGAPLDRQSRRDGRTALHMACRFGNVRSLKVLLDAGARRDLTDFKVLTARDLADHYHFQDCVNLIDGMPDVPPEMNDKRVITHMASV